MGRALALLATACGRLSFDARGDGSLSSNDGPGLTGHDEDGDGIPDSVDLCPHIADPTQPDQDGDGIGDGCDPVIDQAGSSRCCT